MTRFIVGWPMICFLVFWAAGIAPLNGAEPEKKFRAGAGAIDITPSRFPVIVNGMFEERYAQSAADRLMARAIVLDDGQTKIALCVVDSLMMTRELIDSAKKLAGEVTKIPSDKILVSATHTHSAPSAMGCLGSGVDKDYAEALPALIAKSIALADKHLEPAKIGWGVVQDPDHTHCRRWIRRPDKLLADPFGVLNVRANMHPGYQNPDCIGPSGPADPDFSVLSVRAKSGRPIAVLANYAMHYFGSPLISGDVCGRFGPALSDLITAKDPDFAKNPHPAFVGILSQGTSGDIMWMDYGEVKSDPGLDNYTLALAKNAEKTIAGIKHHDWVPLAMAESKLTLQRRTPDAERLAWATKIVSQMKKPLPATQAEIYAREQVLLHEEPRRELKLQAIRIGDLGITALPNEVYALTGLKLKRQSPLETTFNIELANGADGYIPPPEQHKLGGYTTWAARTAGLETGAEPKIVAEVLNLLEQVAGKPRKPLTEESGAYVRSVLESKPVALWRMNEMAGAKAVATDRTHEAGIEDGIAFYLDGPDGPSFSGSQTNRAMHFAGGRLRASLPELKTKYSIELWFFNGMPAAARPNGAILASRGDGRSPAGDHWGIAGADHKEHTGKLLFSTGDSGAAVLTGRKGIPLKSWNHVIFVRDGRRLTVYLNGDATPEIDGEIEPGHGPGVHQWFIGGRSDGRSNWEGKLDELAVYDRPLTAKEAGAHFAAATAPVGR